MDLRGAIARSETVRTERGALELYRMISRELDANPEVDGDDYWDAYAALNALAVNFPGIEDSVADPFPLHRHVRQRTKEHAKPLLGSGFRFRPKWIAVGVAVVLGFGVVKPVLDAPGPCPSGQVYFDTSLERGCENAAGNTTRILWQFGVGTTVEGQP